MTSNPGSTGRGSIPATRTSASRAAAPSTFTSSGNAKDALSAFEATLKKEPNRLGAYAGAARAAVQLGDTAKARQYFGKIVEQVGSEGSTRTEVADARKYLDGH